MLKLKKNYSIVFLVVLVLSLSKYVLVIEDVAASTNRNFAPMCDTLIVQISNNSPICMGNMATLTANGGNTYSWSNGSDTSNISVATAGVYTVTATDASGCTGVASTNVVINSLPTATRLIQALLVMEGWLFYRQQVAHSMRGVVRQAHLTIRM